MESPLTIIAVALVAFFIPAGQATEPRRVEQAEKSSQAAAGESIPGIAEEWRRLYNSGDAAKVAALYAEDGYYLSAHILAHGRMAIEDYWRRGIVAGGHIDFIKPLAVLHSGDLGYAVGTYQATNAGVTVDGRVLLVFKRTGGKWLIAAHETVVRDQP